MDDTDVGETRICLAPGLDPEAEVTDGASDDDGVRGLLDTMG